MAPDQPTDIMNSTLEAWLQEVTAQTSHELECGDGNDPDIINAMRSFLNGSVTASQAAVAITRPIAFDDDPPSKTYRLWGLLGDSIGDRGLEASQKSIDLLAAVKALPPTPQIDWSDLNQFGHMWHDGHSLSYDPGPWEDLAEERKVTLCQAREEVGIAEASMWLRNLDAIDPNQGYEVLNLACLGRPGIQMFLHQIYSWLKVAGLQLRLGKEPDATMTLPKVGTARNLASITMEEHWADWENGLMGLGGEGSSLLADTKILAAECLQLMRDATKQDPRSSKSCITGK